MTTRKDETSPSRYVAPVFNEYSFNELADRTGYGIAYLDQVARGAAPLNRRFRINVSACLQRSEEELFGVASVAGAASAAQE